MQSTRQTVLLIVVAGTEEMSGDIIELKRLKKYAHHSEREERAEL